jgi:hypothetical protein
MNRHLIESRLRGRLYQMTDAQLEAVERDARLLAMKAVHKLFEGEPRHGQVAEQTEWETGRTFVNELVDRLVDHVRINPSDMQRLKSFATQRPTPKKMRRDPYVTEELRKRDVAEDRWNAIKEEIVKANFPNLPPMRMKAEKMIACAPLPHSPGLRLAELIADAEFSTSAYTLGDINPVKRHLREERIDALAAFLASLANPMETGTQREATAESASQTRWIPRRL